MTVKDLIIELTDILKEHPEVADFDCFSDPSDEYINQIEVSMDDSELVFRTEIHKLTYKTVVFT